MKSKSIISCECGRLVERESLWDSFSLCIRPHMIVSLVGAGGKTTVMYHLARELAARGQRVMVTTSTHIYRPGMGEGQNGGDIRFLEIGRAEDAAGILIEAGVLAVGSAEKNPEKVKGLPEKEIQKLAAYADVLLVEADGAKGLPIKVPATHEPVIAAGTDVVIGCLGLNCLGKKLKEICFRPELAAALLANGNGERSGGGYDGNHCLTAGDAAKILLEVDGTRKNVGQRPYRMVLNKADGEAQIRKAEEIIRCMGEEWMDKCVVTSFSLQAERSS